MKLLKGVMLAAAIAVGAASFSVDAIGWPANYEGVMLQGFYWDSWDVTGWSKLEAQADELSKSFSLIWVPNSARPSYYPGNGYDPVYWFTNHNTPFGSEEELRSMILTFKSKGTGIIEDVVINHRVGVTGKTDFPTEEWNGRTWHIGLDGICSTDEISSDPGQPDPTGAPDTGWNWDAMCDLDHTNANVQENCKNYCKFLLEDMGYAGFRYDFVKGYGGEYTKMYNQYSRPAFSVAEYWDESYDAVAAWIESTGRESAAFDFPFKFKVNEAFHSGDMTKLVWKANGVEDQPAGMIHYGYSQLAVTFIDNHDTYRDGNDFRGNIPAANAFMLCSPGTPCVFWPHWEQYKDEISRLIEARNSVGIHNNSKVKVLRSDTDCYMAEVTGKRGRLVVKVGPAMVSPEGYSDSDIFTAGNDYCVWVKSDTLPSQLYLIGNFNGWNPAESVAADSEKNGVFTWNRLEMPAADNDLFAYFSFITERDASWDMVNSSDRYGSVSKDEYVTEAAHMSRFAGGDEAWETTAWKADPGVYRVIADVRNMTITFARISTADGAPYGYPSSLYLIGGFNGWNPATSVSADIVDGGVYTWNCVDLPAAKGDIASYFSFVTERDASWDVVNASDRYGAPLKDTSVDGTAAMRFFRGGNDAGSAHSWKAIAGEYRIVADLRDMTVSIRKTGHGAGNYPRSLYLIGSFNGWSPDASVVPDASGKGVYMWDCVNMPSSGDDNAAYFSFVTERDDSWEAVNKYDRYGAVYDNADTRQEPSMRFFAGGDEAWLSSPWKAEPGDYRIIADLRDMSISAVRLGDDTADFPSDLYIVGSFNGWNPAASVVADSKERGVYVWNSLLLPAVTDDTVAYFSFVTTRHPEWNMVNTTHRYGAQSENASIDGSAPVRMFHSDINSASAYAWKATAGTYKVTADLRNMKVSLSQPITSGVDYVEMADGEVVPVYYNMQGIRVDRPAEGLYIVVRGNKVTKEYVR